MTTDSNKNTRLVDALTQQLLMPDELVRNIIKENIDEYGFDPNSMSKTEAESVIAKCANRLGVSYKTMSYRTKALEIFTLN